MTTLVDPLVEGQGAHTGVEIVNRGTDAPEHFLAAVEAYLSKALEERSLLDESGMRRVHVSVTDYRMRSGFTRAMFGLFAGKDGIDSEVIVTDAASGDELARSTVTSYNVMASGGMDDIARMHAEEIVHFLAGDEG